MAPAARRDPGLVRRAVLAVLATVCALGAGSCDSEPRASSTSLAHDVICSDFEELEAVTASLFDPEVFDLDLAGLRSVLERRRALLADIQAHSDHQLADLVEQRLRLTEVADQLALEAWSTDFERLRASGESWLHVAVGDRLEVDGERLPSMEQQYAVNRTTEVLAVRCRAPELAEPPAQDLSVDPPAGFIDFHRPTGNEGRRERIASTGTIATDLSNPDNWHWVVMPDLAPSGTSVVVKAEGADGYGLLVLNDDMTVNAVLQQGEPGFDCPSWSPDGSAVIATVSTSDPDEAEIYRFELDGTSHRLDLPRWIRGCVTFVGPDRLAAFTPGPNDAEHTGIWVIGLDGSDPIEAPMPRDCVALLTDTDPTGTRLAASRCGDPTQNGLWIIDLADSTTTHVVAGNVAVPKFSPNGEWLVFGYATLGSDPSEDVAIWIVRSDGMGLRELAPSTASFPVWLPEPRRTD
jgi:hypothetical protein